MGFKAKRKLYRLVFEDEDMHGLEVTMRGMSVGKVLELEELTSKIGAVPADGTLKGGTFHTLMGVFAAAIEDWNLENADGEPIPTTLAGVLEQDAEFLMTIIRAWTTALGGVSGPLDSGSTSSGTFPEVSIPVEPLSPSLAS